MSRECCHLLPQAASSTEGKGTGSVCHANAKGGLPIKEVLHLAEEYAQQIKHKTQETLRSAKADL